MSKHDRPATLVAALSLALVLLDIAGPARAATTAAPVSVGGHILGLDAICGDCTVEKVTSDCEGPLEAPVFDRDGNLWVAGILKGVLYKVTPAGQCTVGIQLPPEIKYPCGLRFASDGTLYGVALGSGLFSVDLSTKKTGLIATGLSVGGFPSGAFHGLDDIFIDSTGGMYLTDAAGSSVLTPVGRLLYRNAKGDMTELVSGGLMFPNGVVLSPDEKTLYVDEWSANRILAVPVVSPGVISTPLSHIFAQMSGGVGPDSMTADSAGNVYAAHFGSSEIVVFAPNGDYFGAIQLPMGAGADPTNVAIHQGWLYITELEKHTIWRVKTKIPGIQAYGGR